MEQVNFSKYGKSFQEKLAQLILQERIFADQIWEVLDINFLELKYLQVFVCKIFDYKEKYRVHPSPNIVATILRSDLEKEDEVTQKQVRDFFVKISMNDIEIDGADYIKEVALDFCRKQKLKGAILKSVDLLQKSSFEEISNLINEAIKLGSDNNFGYDYKVDFEKRFETRARSPMTTGWKLVDEICGGGLGVGELGVVIAPTGAGKSMALVHLGAEALKAGKTVIHYTLELQDMTIASRYDSCITGVSLPDLHDFKEHIYDKVQEIEGNLIVKSYPTKSASVNTIKTHLERMKQRGINIDLIVVDYADLLRPNTSHKEKRIELESIYEELRGVAAECDCPLWTASQTNRSGLNAEVITMESISEAFNKCFVADFIFSISRTIQDKSANTGRMFVAKNRNGPDGLIYPIFMDTKNVNIRVLPQTNETVDEIIAKTAKDQLQELKEKYKKHKSSGGA
jgi:KaiC/GvpD/RAD55 family RecA-like ATPase